MATSEEKQIEKEGASKADTGIRYPSRVQLPRASPSHAAVSFTSDDSEDHASKNLWQVYALGGFMLVRWLWARWRERRSRRFSDEDDD